MKRTRLSKTDNQVRSRDVDVCGLIVQKTNIERVLPTRPNEARNIWTMVVNTKSTTEQMYDIPDASTMVVVSLLMVAFTVTSLTSVVFESFITENDVMVVSLKRCSIPAHI